MQFHRIRRSAITGLCALSALSSALSAQSNVKVPRPLRMMPDVKTPYVAPKGPIEAAPAREVPAGAPLHANLPAKSVSLESASASAFAPDFSAVRFDEPGDGALWVRGRTYKARFDADRATYIPFLGSQAPRNYPLAIELASVTIDGGEIALEHGERTRDGNDVTLAHGVLREVWHLGLAAAEQTFVFDARPSGDVELRLAFESELSARETQHGIEFDGESGGVRMTNAIAIDADGRRLALATHAANGRITIALPASFSASARYPLVIDPVFSTNAFETSTTQSGAPDIANSSLTGTWCAVYQFFFSANDVDVWAQDIYYGQPVANTGFWVDYTSARWFTPRIAYNALHDTFLTVAGVYGTTNSVMARAHYAHTTNALAQVVVENTTNAHDPDVGGDPTLVGPTYFFAVWTRNFSATDADIHGRLIDWDGTPLGTGAILIENSSINDYSATISKTDGHAPFQSQRWNVVWRRDLSAGDIWGAQINWDGNIATPAFAIDSTISEDSLPSASSLLDGGLAARPWMVTFTRRNGDLDILSRVLVGSTTVGGSNVSVDEYGAIYEDQNYSDVDTNGQRFVVTYCETFMGNPADRDQYVATMHWDGANVIVDEAHQNVDYSTNDSVQGQVSGCMSDSSQGYPYYGLAWPRYGSVADVYVGAYYEPALVASTCPGDGSAGTCPCGNNGTSGRGCANSVTSGGGLFPQGNPWLSSDTFSLFAFGLPTSTTCLYFQGTSIGATGTAFGDGLRCIAGAVTRIGTKTAVGGVATYPEAGDVSISLKGLVSADGGWRGYQVWYRNAAAFCTPSTFNMTSGVRVIWVR